MNTIEITPERQQNVYYANPIYIEQAVVVVSTDEASDGNFFATLTNRVIKGYAKNFAYNYDSGLNKIRMEITPP